MKVKMNGSVQKPVDKVEKQCSIVDSTKLEKNYDFVTGDFSFTI